MRRFFQAHRSEDYSQIQYLTAKCTRLLHDRAVLERDFLLGRERERRLQSELEAAKARLLGHERLNLELRARQELLVGRMQQQQELLDVLQRRLEESCRGEELLHGPRLLSLQNSELRPRSLVGEVRAEAQRWASMLESLRSELYSKMVELEELRGTNKRLMEELQHLRAVNQKQVSNMHQRNQASVGELQQTAEQCERLHRQQRHRMFCNRRFKESLTEERRALSLEVSELESKSSTMKLH